MNRTRVVLSVVETDNTFELVCGSDSWFWLGKCIHCNTRITVDEDGDTRHRSNNTTLEHIVPICAGGDPVDPCNLALACKGCNNRKGIDHDKHVGKGGRADEVIASLQSKRAARWRDAVQL